MIVTPYQAIDWAVPSCKVSVHATVGELLWLPTWGRLATRNDGLTEGVTSALFAFATGPLDALLEALEAHAAVHVAYRPQTYNGQIGGAGKSAHMCLGPWAAIDFHVASSPGSAACAGVRERILQERLLDRLGLRMEQPTGDGTWIHIDNHPVGAARYFMPNPPTP